MMALHRNAAGKYPKAKRRPIAPVQTTRVDPLVMAVVRDMAACPCRIQIAPDCESVSVATKCPKGLHE